MRSIDSMSGRNIPTKAPSTGGSVLSLDQIYNLTKQQLYGKKIINSNDIDDLERKIGDAISKVGNGTINSARRSS